MDENKSHLIFRVESDRQNSMQADARKPRETRGLEVVVNTCTVSADRLHVRQRLATAIASPLVLPHSVFLFQTDTLTTTQRKSAYAGERERVEWTHMNASVQPTRSTSLE